MTNAMTACERRSDAAARYRPDRVRLLLVAEAPPRSLDRYFYFEDVPEQDALFRYVVRTVLGKEPARAEKAAHLHLLKACGVFLIDLKPEPKVDGEPLEPFVDDLVARAVGLRPEHVITIKANVCTLTQAPLRAAGLRVVDERVPFPGSGQQGRFVEAIARLAGHRLGLLRAATRGGGRAPAGDPRSARSRHSAA